MNTCFSCGSAVKETDLYCRSCGIKLIVADEKLIRRGRTIFIIAALLILALEVFSSLFELTIESFTIGIRNYTCISDIVSGLITITLLYLVYRGYSWARWVIGLLSLAGSLLALVYLLQSLTDLVTMLILGITSAALLCSAGLLLIIPDVKAFQKAQRESYSKRGSDKRVK